MNNDRFKMGLVFIVLFCFLFHGSAMANSAETPASKGRQIMEAVDNLPILEKTLTETVLQIFDARNNQLFSKRSRSAVFYSDFDRPEHRLKRTITYFFAPADSKGNAALMIEIKGNDDDQWIYLKGLRKPKRVIGSDKSSAFMGSDFSNGDVSARDIDDFHFKWLSTEKIRFRNRDILVEKIESVFRKSQQSEDYGYSRMISWVHVKTGLSIKNQMYDLNNQLYKTSRVQGITVRKNRNGRKVFLVTKMEMKNHLKGTRTVMKLVRIRTGKSVSKIQPRIFSVDYLTRHWW